MRRIIFIMCVTFTFVTSAYAGEMYGCLDRDGKRIITDKPQDGMTDCVTQGSDEDSSLQNKIKSQKIIGKGSNSQCDLVAGTMNNARKYLNQASNRRTSELEAGKEDVRKAIDYLNKAENLSSYCECPSLDAEISEAAKYAQYASNETSVSQFSDLLTRAIRAFNNAQEAFNLCR